MRRRKLWRRLLQAIGLLLLTAILAVTGFFLWLDTASGREWACVQINAALADVLVGDARIERLSRLTPWSLEGGPFRVQDDQGQVLLVQGISADISLFDALVSWSMDERLTLRIPRVHLAYADVSLDADAPGDLRLAQVFQPDNAPGAGGPPEESAPIPTVVIERVVIAHGWAHGDPGLVLVDGDADDVVAAVTVTDERVLVTVYEATVQTRAMPRNANLEGEVRGELSIPTNAPLTAILHYVHLGEDLPVTIDGTVRDESFSATAEIGPAGGAALARILPFTIRGTTTARVSASGDLDHVEASFEVAIHGGSELSGAAEISLSPGEVRVTTEMDAKRIDISALAANAPPSRLDGWLQGTMIVRGSERVSGRFSARTGSGDLDGYRLPAASLRGTVDNRQIEVHGVIDEPGARGHVHARANLGERWRAEADVRIGRVDLGALRWTPTQWRGTGRLVASASYAERKSGAPHVAGCVTASFTALSVPPLAARRLQIDASGSGPIGALSVVASATAHGASVAGFEVARAEARAAGSLHDLDVRLDASLRVGGIRSVVASAKVSLRSSLRNRVQLRHIAVAARGPTSDVRLDAPRAAVTGKRLNVPEVRIEGLGTPISGSLLVERGRLVVGARGERLSLGALAALVGSGEPIRGDLEHLDLRLDRTGSAVSGHVSGLLEHGQWRRWGRLRAAVDLRMEDQRIDGNIWMMLGPDTQLALDIAPLSLPDGALSLGTLSLGTLSLGTLQRATGNVFGLISGDAARLRSLACELGLAPRWLHEHTVTGRLTLSARARREASEQPPSLVVGFAADSLTIRDRTTKQLVMAPLDIDLDARLGALTGRARLEVSVRDAVGLLLFVDGRADLPVAAIWQNGGPGPAMGAIEVWRDVPFRLRIHAPFRDIHTLPFLESRDATGRASFKGVVAGTLANPDGTLTLALRDIRSRRLRIRAPLDADLHVEVKPTRADVAFELRTPRRRILSATATLDARVADVVRGKIPDWELNGDVELHSLALERILPLRDKRVAGNLSGWISVAHVNRGNMRVVAEFEAESLVLGDAQFQSGRVGLRADAKEVHVVLGLASADDGHARIKATLPTAWSRGRVTLREGARIELLARKFEIAALHPLVENTFGELGGLLDANATLELGSVPRFSGKLALTGGHWQVAGYGETFTDTTARLTFENNGVVRLHELEATSLSGQLIASGRARFDGWALESARLDVRVPRDRPLPVVIQGQHYGDAWGRVRIGARARSDRMMIDIDVPKLELELAKHLPRDARKLGAARTIRIGMRKKGRFEPVAVGPEKTKRSARAIPLHLQLELGDVTVRQNRAVFIVLSGSPRFVVNRKVRGVGHIDVVRGKLDVQGKEFEIVRGRVTFTGQDVDNPLVFATAKWVAPDGTEIFVDFAGPVAGGKVTLRSYPPLTRDQIVATLLFGAPEGATPAGQGADKADRATQAVGLGGTVVATGVNEAISNITSLDIGVHVDTSHESGPAPELEVAIARTVSVQLSHLLGVPPPGDSPDRSFATLSWRFLAEWVFETTVGDHGGTSLDVRWQHRY